MAKRGKLKAAAEAADPDKLKRETAGSYRTADGRFEVREAGIGWYLVDTTQQNEFGQELLHGPYDTLKDVRAAIPGARTEAVTPIKRPKASAGRSGRQPAKTDAAAGRQQPAPPPPPPSWIDRLRDAEATEVRRIIRALEAEGIEDAERLTRRDREGLGPAIAEQLIVRRLAAIVAERPEDEREAARALVERVARVLTVDGTKRRGALPGWSLVEIGPEEEPRNRRITVR
jgi:hypothetical protein